METQTVRMRDIYNSCVWRSSIFLKIILNVMNIKNAMTGKERIQSELTSDGLL